MNLDQIKKLYKIHISKSVKFISEVFQPIQQNTRGKKILLCEWKICIEINCGTTNCCVQQRNIQALRKAKLKQASTEPLSSTGGYLSLRV